jgi:hypothetical protein
LRGEVRRKVSRLIRARWFAPPFSGIGFSRLLAEALDAMARSPADAPLLPPRHPLDLLVTATDFTGHPTPLHLNSPPLVEENEHRLAIGFQAQIATLHGRPMAALPELVLAARATASFPGAFPRSPWPRSTSSWPNGAGLAGARAFVARIMPTAGGRARSTRLPSSMAPFWPTARSDRPCPPSPAAPRGASRPPLRLSRSRPHNPGASPASQAPAPIGFLSAIFGALSTIPREQPIRDNLEALERQSRERQRVRAIVENLKPEIEDTVVRLFGHTLFFDRPSHARLISWRARASRPPPSRPVLPFTAMRKSSWPGSSPIWPP